MGKTGKSGIFSKPIPTVCLSFVLLLTILGIAGWLFDRPIFASFNTHYIPMAPGTALMLLLLCGALLVHRDKKSGTAGKTIALVASIAVIVNCALVIAGFLTKIDLDISRLFLPAPPTLGLVSTGRMSNITAGCLILEALAHILLLSATPGNRVRNRSIAGILSFSVAMIALTILIGYLYGSPLLYGGTLIPVALPTAFALFFLAFATMASVGPDAWPAMTFSGDSVLARLTRAFLPLSLVSILVYGWLAHELVPHIANPALAAALMSLLYMAVFGLIVSQAALRTSAEIDAANAAAEKARQELQNSEESLSFIIEGSQLGTWDWNIATNTVKRNRTCFEILGYEREDSGYTPAEWKNRINPEDRPVVFASLQNHLQGKTPLHEVEYRMRTNDGKEIWVSDRARVVQRDAGGRPLRMSGIFADITERKHAEDEIQKLNRELERRVAERTRQLELANEELEAFSYAVSHDLRAPLRAMDGFSTALLDTCGPTLDVNGKHYLERIKISTQRMSDLIDALLNLSRVTKSGLTRQTVDLGALAREIVIELREREPERTVSVSISDGLEVQGDPQLLGIVLENLLGNAFKFTSHSESAAIALGMEFRNGETVYFVRDTGAGFDMAQASTLFTPFHRLHSTKQYAGTGIGLVTVQRIIIRHGGRIWPDAKPDCGATFYFTLGTTPS